jgi:hypothetical protein
MKITAKTNCIAAGEIVARRRNSGSHAKQTTCHTTPHSEQSRKAIAVLISGLDNELLIAVVLIA